MLLLNNFMHIIMSIVRDVSVQVCRVAPVHRNEVADASGTHLGPVRVPCVRAMWDQCGAIWAPMTAAVQTRLI